MTQWRVIEDYCCSSLENENTLAIEMRKHFTEASTEGFCSNLCLAAIIKSLKNVHEVVKFQKT